MKAFLPVFSLLHVCRTKTRLPVKKMRISASPVFRQLSAPLRWKSDSASLRVSDAVTLSAAFAFSRQPNERKLELCKGSQRFEAVLSVILLHLKFSSNSPSLQFEPQIEGNTQDDVRFNHVIKWETDWFMQWHAKESGCCCKLAYFSFILENTWQIISNKWTDMQCVPSVIAVVEKSLYRQIPPCSYQIQSCDLSHSVITLRSPHNLQDLFSTTALTVKCVFVDEPLHIWEPSILCFFCLLYFWGISAKLHSLEL